MASLVHQDKSLDYGSGTLEEKSEKDITQSFRNKYRVDYVFFDEKYPISGGFQLLSGSTP